MIGTSEFNLNEATIIAAVQLYLHEVMSGKTLRVTSVKQRDAWFAVTVDADVVAPPKAA